MNEAHRKRRNEKKKIVLFTHFTCSYFNSSSCLFYIMFIRLSFYSILKEFFFRKKERISQVRDLIDHQFPNVSTNHQI